MAALFLCRIKLSSLPPKAIGQSHSGCVAAPNLGFASPFLGQHEAKSVR